MSCVSAQLPPLEFEEHDSKAVHLTSIPESCCEARIAFYHRFVAPRSKDLRKNCFVLVAPLSSEKSTTES